ncbi:MAG: MgtC/SapB family protein [Candidatus Hydrogenedentota bacterium]
MVDTWHMLPEISLKFALAIVLAGLVGIERERKGRSAGLRTHILVCLGSTLAMIVSDIIAMRWAEQDTTVTLDQGRIAAGIITGVGFLGAGTIINVGSHHRGLTTAALIWFVAALGLAIGGGLYGVAIAATVAALLVVIVLERLARLLPSADRFTLTMGMPHGLGRINEVETFIRAQGYEVLESRLRIAEEEQTTEITLELVTRLTRARMDELASKLQEQFDAVRWITFER